MSIGRVVGLIPVVVLSVLRVVCSMQLLGCGA